MWFPVTKFVVILLFFQHPIAMAGQAQVPHAAAAYQTQFLPPTSLEAYQQQPISQGQTTIYTHAAMAGTIPQPQGAEAGAVFGSAPQEVPVTYTQAAGEQLISTQPSGAEPPGSVPSGVLSPSAVSTLFCSRSHPSQNNVAKPPSPTLMGNPKT